MNNNDYGAQPYVINIEELTKANDYFRVAKWTGQYMQMTIMAIPVDEEIGLEVHEDHDQFLRIEEGNARVVMGASKDKLDFVEEAHDDFAIFVPAGKWHNVINIGDVPLKLYSIYSPPEHPAGTIHPAAQDAANTES